MRRKSTEDSWPGVRVGEKVGFEKLDSTETILKEEDGGRGGEIWSVRG